MRKVAVFGEDTAHEKVLTTVLSRFAHDHGVATSIKVFSSQGGLTRLHFELKQFLKDVDRKTLDTPDLIVVAADSNCVGYTERRKGLEEVVAKFQSLKDSVAYAIPDPHIERWLLVDPVAFKSVFGRGCQPLPAVKCKKDDYKQLLFEEVQKASGTRPLLGGIEYTTDLVNSFDLSHVEQKEPSFEKLLKDLKGRYNSWKQHDETPKKA